MKKIPNSVCNRNQARKALQRRPIRLTESDRDFIFVEIKRQDTIEYYRDMNVDNKYY